MKAVTEQSANSCPLPLVSETDVVLAARSLGLYLRAAEAKDFARITAIAFNSFPLPLGLFDDPNDLAHYCPDFASTSDYGEIHVVVAETATSAVVGYCFYQLRHGGDIYLQELAANPPAGQDKCRGAGTAMLAYALVNGVECGYSGPATVNILCEHRVCVPALSWRDPVPFYEGLGYVATKAIGYRASGLARDPADTWMTGDPSAIVRAAIGCLTTYAKAYRARPMLAAPCRSGPSGNSGEWDCGIRPL